VQVTAVVWQVRRRNATTQAWELAYYEYAHRDHLGSAATGDRFHFAGLQDQALGFALQGRRDPG
jgi:hypothetical protein